MNHTHVVTGATGYTGKYITRLLVECGDRVRSLTGHPDRPNPFGPSVETYPYSFDDPDKLASSLEGADTLFNTYWIRFARGELTHDRAVENLRTLFDAARVAGVRRVVHISITNATEDSPSPYFRGKALAERALRESGTVLRDSQADPHLRARGHPAKQHRVDAAQVPSSPDCRLWGVQGAADFRR